MNFSAFILFFYIVVWLSFGPKWLLRQITCKKDQSLFYSQLYQFRHALPVLGTYIIMILLKLIYQWLEVVT